MQGPIKTVFLNLIACFLGNGMLFATEPEKMKFPPIDKRFEELYNELKKEEDELLEKFKKQYPNVPQDAWQRYYELPQEAFAAIKKEYPGTPACEEGQKVADQLNRLRRQWREASIEEKENADVNKISQELNQLLESFLKKYTECATEINGIDPEKINIFYKHSDHKLFADDQNSYTASRCFLYEKQIFVPYYVLTANTKENAPHILINIPLFIKTLGGKGDKHASIIPLIGQFISYILLHNNKIDFLNHIINRYYDIDNNFTTLRSEMIQMQKDHAYIVSVMQTASKGSSQILDGLLAYGQDPNKKQLLKRDFDWAKILRYLLKIKQIMQG